MSRVTFCDASGLGVLIGAHERIRQQRGLLRVVCPEGKAMRVIRLTRATHMLPIHPTLDDALTAPVDPDPVGG
jgi:anti-sigma B factor antagonist